MGLDPPPSDQIYLRHVGADVAHDDQALEGVVVLVIQGLIEFFFVKHKNTKLK